MKFLKITLLLLACMLLAACVSMRPATISAQNKKIPWSRRKFDLNQITAWKLSGAVAVKLPSKAFTASLNWRQKNTGRYTLNLFGPLGVGAVVLNGEPGEVILQNSSGQKFMAATPEQLLRDHMGWSLPVSNLYYWVRGLPAPGLPDKIKLDQFGHLKTLQQQGWIINYLRYTAVGKNDLPSKIEMNNKRMSVKIVISSWSL
jgi:outer membrane lipoprotein LolB